MKKFTMVLICALSLIIGCTFGNDDGKTGGSTGGGSTDGAPGQTTGGGTGQDPSENPGTSGGTGTTGTGTTGTTSGTGTTGTTGTTTGTGTGGTGTTGTGTTTGDGTAGTGTGGPAFLLQSNDIVANGQIGAAYAYPHPDCRGIATEGRSPELHWTGAPTGTNSFAITMIDKYPDLENFFPGGFKHWLLYNLSSTRSSIDRSYTIAPMEGFEGIMGINDYAPDPMDSGYAGPCPCEEHPYEFTVWALNVADLSGEANQLDGNSVMAAIENHDIGSASFRANWAGEPCP